MKASPAYIDPEVLADAEAPAEGESFIAFVRSTCGEELGERLCKVFGPGRLYIAKNDLSRLEAVIGFEAAVLISRHYHDQTVSIPRAGSTLSEARRQRDARAVAMLRAGVPCLLVARELNLTPRRIQQIAAEEKARRKAALRTHSAPC